MAQNDSPEKRMWPRGLMAPRILWLLRVSSEARPRNSLLLIQGGSLHSHAGAFAWIVHRVLWTECLSAPKIHVLKS